MEDAPKKTPEAATGEELLPTERVGIVAEFWLFLRENKTYWMLPILLVLLVLAGLVMLGSTAAAPFIYSLF